MHQIIPFFFEEIYCNEKPTYYIKTPFDKTLFHGSSDNFLLIRGKLNTIDYTYQQNDSLLKALIRYCADLSTYRENLLFSNHHKEKIDSIENLISVCDRNLKVLADSTKTLEEKARIFMNQADSIKNVEKEILAQIESVEKQINDLNIKNTKLDVNIEHLDSANRVQKVLMRWGWYGDSQEYDRNKKTITQLGSRLSTKKQKYEKVHKEYELAKDNYQKIETEHNGINTNTIIQQKENLEKELASLYVKKDDLYFYGNEPKYVLRHKNIEIGDYLKVILGEDNGSFGKVVLTYKKDGDKWVFYASEMIDGTKYKLAQ